MKKEPIDLRNISLRRSTRLQNNAHVDPLVKIEDREEERTRLKRCLRQLATSESSVVADGTNSNEDVLETRRDDNDLYCKICNYTYETRKIYLTHQVQVHWDKIPEKYCNFCERTFYSRPAHLTHLYNAHDINMHHMRENKIRHQDITPDIYDENDFCSACEHTFSSKASFHNHLKVVHTIEIPFNVRKKSRIRNFDTIPDIDDPNNFCSACDYKFSKKYTYRFHLFNVHGISIPKKYQKWKVLYPDKTPDTSDPNNFCIACDRTFASRPIYRYHLQNIHNIGLKCQLKLPSFNRTPDINDPKNFCNSCGFTYSTKDNYHTHLKNIHDIKVPKRFRSNAKIPYSSRIPDINDPNNFCNGCGYTFSAQSTYRYHLVNTHGIKVPRNRNSKLRIRYPDRIPDIEDSNNFCNTCDYTFSTKGSYHHHLVNKHGIKVPKKRHLK